MSSRPSTDPDWVAPIYRTTDPVGATLLQEFLEDRSVPALLETRAWGNLPVAAVGLLQPTLYQVLLSAGDLEAHRGSVEEALAEVRKELGTGSEVN